MVWSFIAPGRSKGLCLRSGRIANVPAQTPRLPVGPPCRAAWARNPRGAESRLMFHALNEAHHVYSASPHCVSALLAATRTKKRLESDRMHGSAPSRVAFGLEPRRLERGKRARWRAAGLDWTGPRTSTTPPSCHITSAIARSLRPCCTTRTVADHRGWEAPDHRNRGLCPACPPTARQQQGLSRF